VSIRSDLAGLIASEVDVPVYDSIHDGMSVPSIVLYPASTFLDRDAETFGGLVWHWTATILAGRSDLEGLYDRIEGLILGIVSSGIASRGTTWTTGGNYRTETIAGVDYVAADMYLTTHTDTKGVA
jgi:hypothetical protein